MPSGCVQGQQNLLSHPWRGGTVKAFHVGFWVKTAHGVFHMRLLAGCSDSLQTMSYGASAQRVSCWKTSISVAAISAAFCLGWALAWTTTTSLQVFAPSTVGVRMAWAPVALSKGASRLGLRHRSPVVAAGPEASKYFEQPQPQVCGRPSARIGRCIGPRFLHVRSARRLAAIVGPWGL